jgi:hypothetical protein
MREVRPHPPTLTPIGREVWLFAESAHEAQSDSSLRIAHSACAVRSRPACYYLIEDSYPPTRLPCGIPCDEVIS